MNIGAVIITEQNVDYAIALSMEGNADAITEIDKDVIARTVLGKPIKPKTLGQPTIDLCRKIEIVLRFEPDA